MMKRGIDKAMFVVNDERTGKVFHQVLSYLQEDGQAPGDNDAIKRIYMSKGAEELERDYIKSVALCEKAGNYIEKKKIKKAEKLYCRAYDTCPLNSVALRNVAEYCVKLDKFILALYYLEQLMYQTNYYGKVLQEKPEVAIIQKYRLYVYISRSICFYFLENFTEANWAVDKALDIDAEAVLKSKASLILQDARVRRG